MRPEGMRKAIGLIALAVFMGTAGCAATTTPTATPPVLSTPPPPPSTCPARLPADAMNSVKSSKAPSDTIVPGTPDHAVVCRYEDMNEPNPRQLAKSKSLAGAQAVKLAAALNGGSPMTGGVTSCPADFGRYDLVLFDYSDRAAVHVMVSVSGCRQVTNGHRTLMLGANADSELTAFVGAPEPA